jgi:hypothetical protein
MLHDYIHKQDFILGPNNARVYYNVDTITYTTKTGETIRVLYTSNIFYAGTMSDKIWYIYSSDCAKDEWKFGGLYQSCILFKSSPIRILAKMTFLVPS